jgi:prepilin-type processing-associated H-X9-DG protein
LADYKSKLKSPQPESSGLSLGTLLSFMFAGVLVVSAVLVYRARHEPVGDPPGVKCRENLKQVGLAIRMYINQNKGKLPNSFDDLVTLPGVSPEIFVCPDSTSETAATGPSTQAVAASFSSPGHCSYIYLGKGLTAGGLEKRTVLACEPLADHGGAGINVLFGDGHVEFEKPGPAGEILDQVKAGVSPVNYPK